MAQHCYDIYLPTHDNDGNVFAFEVMAEIQDEMVEVFGGLTLIPNIRGIWKDDGGMFYKDDIVIHRIVCPCNVENHVKIQALQGHLANVLQQKVIFILRHEVFVEEQPVTAVTAYNRGN